MSEYIVSARKYRPDSFETLIGQDNIAQTLKNSIIRGKLAHAYLFCGPRGVGKTTTARIFAKAINCSNPSEDMEPCGKCESCISFQEGRSYCIHELDAASNNGVDDIKNLMDKVQIPPQVGKYSVYIIDEVHMLSTAAFNAFLKTLEEPPAHAIFILATTEKHKILPTILSRCQTFDFNRISVPDIVRNLKEIALKENVSIDDESLHVIARKADGAMRDALTIFDQTVAFCGTDVKYEEVLKNLNVLDYDYSFSLVDSFLAGDFGSALLKFDEILSKGFNALHFCAALSSHFRDLMVTRNGGLDSLLELPDSLRKRYSEQANRCSLKFLYDALGITTACEAGYKQAINPRLHIEFALMRLAFLSKAQAGVSEPVPAKAEATPPKAAAAKAPVAAPAASPVASPAAAPAPRERKKPAKTGSALSLTSILEEEQAAKSAAKAPAVADELPEDEKLQQAWNEIPGEYASSPRLANTLKNALLDIHTEDGIKVLTFKVSNASQEKWIRENRLLSLEGILQRKTGSSRIRLEVGVIPAEEKEAQPYTDHEKATALMGQNGEIQNLVKDFGLETK
ncbi:MAG: DNA polymerase III subunit gamma/tau [Bacteroidales bacterium]|nr:DNA polymerase III subunit gamma/tau [Bacteroidales bacterium]